MKRSNRSSLRPIAALCFIASSSGCIAASSTTTRAAPVPPSPPEPVRVQAAFVPSFTDDSAAVVAAVEAFHRALAAGDSSAALMLLEDDVMILESGGAETREEYRAHHLPADIAFARAVASVRGAVHVRVRGDVAWASSTSTVQGEYRGRAINSAGAELIVLVRRASGWKISAIHWSSRQRR